MSEFPQNYYEAKARAIGRIVARLMDEEGVKPPPKPEFWLKLQRKIYEEIKDIMGINPS